MLKIGPLIWPATICAIMALQGGHRIARQVCGLQGPKMTLRIQQDSGGCATIIRLIGRVRSEHLQELTEVIASAGPGVILDLDEVTLVDLNAVRFLAGCEVEGVQLLHCSPYIREWMLRELSKEKR